MPESTAREDMGSVPVPSASDACAIVVLFHPDNGFSGRLQKLLAQFPAVVLVDNTPGDAVLGELPHVVHLIRNRRNRGIAAALNQGVSHAMERGFLWVATFDQDSELLPGYLDEVVAIAGRYAPQPALVGCNYLRGDSDEVVYTGPADVDTWSRLTLITSGTFMPARFALDAGGFREDFFIDSVDHEFCLRMRDRGARVMTTACPYMRHRMGVAAVGICRPFSLQHSPLRRYYIARNSLLTIRAHGFRHWLWSLRQLGRLVAEGVAIIVFESEKDAKLRNLAVGLWHGILGRSGRREPVE